MRDDLTDVIQIDDPEIDVAEITRRVRENLRAYNLDERLDFPQFTIDPPCFGKDARFPAALYYDLGQATLACGQTWVSLQPTTSRMPLLARLKGAFHRLTVYYANLLGERQMVVNSALLRVLNQMVRTLDRSETEVADLRREVAELRARLDEAQKDEGA